MGDINKARRKLVDALRSGEYTQTKHVLRDDDGALCAMGVACEVSGLTTWREGEDGLQYAVLADGEIVEGQDIEAPFEVLEYYGWGRVDDSMVERANDAGKTFAELADFIEDHWKVP
jgi:hypothetical protein